MKTIVTVLILLILFLPNTFAQADYKRFSLPKGAKLRLGKGRISSNIVYSPDGTRLAVASGIGIWLYDAQTYQEIALLTEHTGWISSVAFSPGWENVSKWQFLTRLSVCGMQSQGLISESSPSRQIGSLAWRLVRMGGR